MSEPVQSPLDQVFESLETQASSALRDELRRQLSLIDLERLEFYDEADLAAEDTVARSRLVYVLSILRLLHYLKQTPGSWDHAHRQAALAMKYVAHAEGTNLKVLQVGRSLNDEGLVTEVTKLRAQMNEIAEFKARRLLKEAEAPSGASAKVIDVETEKAGDVQ